MSGAAAFFAAILALRDQAAPPGGATPLPLANPILAEADEHYLRRDRGHVGARADSGEISAAVAGYDTAAESPENVEARWKLARALYFRASYTGLDAESKKAVWEKARRVSQEALAILARRATVRAPAFASLPPAEKAAALSGEHDAAPGYFWAAVSWGQWALARGRVSAAKTGAAEKIRDYAGVLIALDATFEEAGGYRILGRLHDQAPWIPFLTGWVSRKDALKNLREAVRIAPNNLVNRHFLAEALAKGDPDERDEAVRIERDVVSSPPSPLHLVEELAIQEEASRNLAEWGRSGF